MAETLREQQLRMTRFIRDPQAALAGQSVGLIIDPVGGETRRASLQALLLYREPELRVIMFRFGLDVGRRSSTRESGKP